MRARPVILVSNTSGQRDVGGMRDYHDPWNATRVSTTLTVSPTCEAYILDRTASSVRRGTSRATSPVLRGREPHAGPHHIDQHFTKVTTNVISVYTIHAFLADVEAGPSRMHTKEPCRAHCCMHCCLKHACQTCDHYLEGQGHAL